MTCPWPSTISLEKTVMNKVLVTGADGFLGRNFISMLLRHGKVVYAVVYPGRTVYEKNRNGRLHVIYMDLNDGAKHLNEFPSDIDVMYHFAWTGVKPEQRNDLETQMSNIKMSLECMKLANALKIKKVIFAGSTNEYLYCGKAINKDAVPSPGDAYGAVKTAVRYLCGSYAQEYHIGFIYAVIGSIYAADRRDNNVIFYTIDKLLRREKPSLTKLEQLWDYVYIDDVTEALRLIGEKGKGGAVYAIGHGDNWALGNYIQMIHQIIDPSLPLGIGDIPYKSGVLPSSCMDLTDLVNDTGFVPKVGFEEGIKRVINHMRKDIDERNGR